MMTETRRYTTLLRLALPAVLLLAAGCDPKKSDSTDGQQEQTTVVDEQTAQVGEPGIAQCTLRKAFAGGPTGSLDLIDPCGPAGEVDLSDGDRLTVDSSGEAFIDFDHASGQTIIWVFYDGSLQLSTCGKASAGNCTTGFTNWSNSNPGYVVKTPSATITLVGTYVLVGYMEEGDRTIVVPYEGATVIGPADAPEGEGPTVGVGEFYTNGPEAPDGDVRSIEEFPALVNQLGIEGWVLASSRRAQLDGVPVPGPVDAITGVHLRGTGVFADDPDVAELLLTGVGWSDAQVGGPITALIGPDAPVRTEAYADRFDISVLDRLREVVPGFVVFVEVPEGAAAADLARVANVIADYGIEMGIDVVIEEIGFGEGGAVLADLAASGETAILLSSG